MEKTDKKPKEENRKLTDRERHKRFLEAAESVGASERQEDFDKAFDRVTRTQAGEKPSG